MSVGCISKQLMIPAIIRRRCLWTGREIWLSYAGPIQLYTRPTDPSFLWQLVDFIS